MNIELIYQEIENDTFGRYELKRLLVDMGFYEEDAINIAQVGIQLGKTIVKKEAEKQLQSALYFINAR